VLDRKRGVGTGDPPAALAHDTGVGVLGDRVDGDGDGDRFMSSLGRVIMSLGVAFDFVVGVMGLSGLRDCMFAI
jgi:hypothetical protein